MFVRAADSSAQPGEDRARRWHVRGGVLWGPPPPCGRGGIAEGPAGGVDPPQAEARSADSRFPAAIRASMGPRRPRLQDGTHSRQLDRSPASLAGSSPRQRNTSLTRVVLIDRSVDGVRSGAYLCTGHEVGVTDARRLVHNCATTLCGGLWGVRVRIDDTPPPSPAGTHKWSALNFQVSPWHPSTRPAVVAGRLRRPARPGHIRNCLDAHAGGAGC
jgi:hypothetical protein